MQMSEQQQEAGKAKKRKEKGHLEYNPKETFALSVTWVLRNEECAKEMLKYGFRVVASATHRDTPCVPIYFFRTSHDQTPAKEFEPTIKTIGEHPHYAKIFKSMSMGVPQQFSLNTLKAGGIDPTPLSWNPNDAFDEEKKKLLGYRPITISLTELYLDSRSFFEHADSPDYLKGYGTIMKGNFSLKAHSRCLGTPSEHMWTTVIEPYLQAKKNDDAIVHFYNSQSNSLDKLVFLEFSIQTNEGGATDWKPMVNELFELVAASVRIAFQEDNQIKVEMSFAFFEPSATLLFNKLRKEVPVVIGQMFWFSDVTFPDNLKHEKIPAYKMMSGKNVFFSEDGSSVVAGYVLHEKYGETRENEAIVWNTPT